MKFNTNIDLNWIIPSKRFNNQDYLKERCKKHDSQFERSLSSFVKYLYFDSQHDGIITFNNKVKNILLTNNLLEVREVIIFKYLFARTNGGEKYHYGSPAIIEAKESKFKCRNCGNPDVRTLCLDHVWVENSLLGFRMLCQNCHVIKSREEDWQGEKKNRNKKEALKKLKQKIKTSSNV